MGTTDRIPVKNFVAPVCVIDRSKEAAERSRLCAHSRQREGMGSASMGASRPAAGLCCAPTGTKRNGSAETFLNADDKGPPFAGPDCGSDRISADEKTSSAGGSENRRHGCRLGRGA